MQPVMMRKHDPAYVYGTHRIIAPTILVAVGPEVRTMGELKRCVANAVCVRELVSLPI